MSEDFSAGETTSPPPPKPPRIPPEADGIQVNFCKSPLCQNFGYPASASRPYRKKGTPTAPGDYTVTAKEKGNPALKCEFCSEVAPLRSNQAIAEEVARMTRYLAPQVQELACPNGQCAQFNVPLTSPGSKYKHFGQSAAGTPRYGAYNPQTLARYLDIYRVYFNYCLVSSKDKKTPAMRLGLAKAPIDPHEILYFS